MFGQLETVRKLLELGADPARKNELDQTVIQVAELGGQGEIARAIEAFNS
jgi:ankyrin repeat protein